MVHPCCNLVGNFGLHPDEIAKLGLISVTSQGSTEVNVITAGGVTVTTVAPSTGTVSISAYAGTERYFGCPGRSGVSVPWISKNDCTEILYMYGGAGKSFISGEIGGYTKFPKISGIDNPVAEYPVVSASASSGPASLYEDSIQRDGYGLIYTGKPWDIDTTIEDGPGGCTVNLTSYGIGEYGDCRLQNLQIQTVPGQIPVVNLSYIYSI